MYTVNLLMMHRLAGLKNSPLDKHNICNNIFIKVYRGPEIYWSTSKSYFQLFINYANMIKKALLKWVQIHHLFATVSPSIFLASPSLGSSPFVCSYPWSFNLFHQGLYAPTVANTAHLPQVWSLLLTSQT